MGQGRRGGEEKGQVGFEVVRQTKMEYIVCTHKGCALPHQKDGRHLLPVSLSLPPSPPLSLSLYPF